MFESPLTKKDNNSRHFLGTGIPIAVDMYPGKAGIVTAVIMTCFGLGGCLGSPIVATFLALYEFKAPFLLVGLILFVDFLLCVIYLPSIREGIENPSEKSGKNDVNYFQFFKQWSSIAVILPLAGVYSICGVRDSAYTLYLKTFLQLDEITIGYVFLQHGLAVILTEPFVGFGVQNGFGSYISVANQFFAVLLIFAFFMPKCFQSFGSIYWSSSIFIALGVPLSTVTNLIYLLLENLAIQQGYELLDAQVIAATGFILVLTTGGSFGSLFIGDCFYEVFGFYNMTLFYATVLFILSVWHTVFLVQNGFMRKIFHNSKNKIAEQEENPFQKQTKQRND